MRGAEWRPANPSYLMEISAKLGNRKIFATWLGYGLGSGRLLEPTPEKNFTWFQAPLKQ